jgi:predicted ATPase
LEEHAEIGSDGFRLASCLDNLHQSDPSRFAKIEDALRLFVPGVEMVRFPAAAPGKKTVLFHEKSGAKVYASEASDGLLLFLAHLTIAYAHGDVGVVLVEEPETGVHPRRLRDIVHLLRAISRGELGLPPVQVVATSHSPYLLDWCSKDEITVFQRDAEGDVQATPLSKVEHIEEQLKDFAPGELIYTFGEQICGSRS